MYNDKNAYNSHKYNAVGMCPNGTTPSPSGATSFSQCRANAGYFNDGHSVAKCPPCTSPSPPGATSISQCKVLAGYVMACNYGCGNDCSCLENVTTANAPTIYYMWYIVVFAVVTAW